MATRWPIPEVLPTNGHHHDLQPWERQSTDTDRSWEAFEVYRQMGPRRSIQKVAEKLGKSRTIMERWSLRHDWRRRVLAWDRHEARIINERVLLGSADMRERLISQAMNLQARAQQRVLKMTDQEIAALSVMETCALMRTGSMIEQQARTFDEDERGGNGERVRGFSADTPPPVFNLVRISKPESHVWVRRSDDPAGCEAFHVPQEVAAMIKQQFPQYMVVL